MPYREGDKVETRVGLDWLPVEVVESYAGPDGERLVVRLDGADTFAVAANLVRHRGADALPVADLSAPPRGVHSPDTRPRQNEPGA